MSGDGYGKYVYYSCRSLLLAILAILLLIDLAAIYITVQFYDNSSISSHLQFKAEKVVVLSPLVYGSTLYIFLSILLKIPRISMGEQGIVYFRLFNKRKVDWYDLTEFTIKEVLIEKTGRTYYQAVCSVAVPSQSKNSKDIILGNVFDTPIGQIVETANMLRRRNIR